MDMDIKVRQRGKPVKDMIKTIAEQTFERTPEALEEIKQAVLKSTRDFINSNRQRPAGTYASEFDKFRRLTEKENLYNTLAESCSIERTVDGKYRLALGEHRFLNAHAPYWYVVNYGGVVPPAAYGFFGSGSAPSRSYGKKQVFHKSKPGGKKKVWLMTPKNPIPAMRYLNHMASVFNKEILKFSIKSRSRKSKI